MSGNQKAIEELEALIAEARAQMPRIDAWMAQQDLRETGKHVGYASVITLASQRIAVLKAEPEPDPSDTKELLMETQTSSSDSPASEPAIPPSVDTGAGVDAGPISSGGGASAGLLEAAWKVCEPWMNGGPVMPSIQSLADAIKAEKQRDTGTVYELAELRERAEKADYSARQFCGAHIGLAFPMCPACTAEKAERERDFLVGEYERAVKCGSEGFAHAASHIYNAIVNAKCDANADRFVDLMDRAEKAEAACAELRERAEKAEDEVRHLSGAAHALAEKFGVGRGATPGASLRRVMFRNGVAR